MAISVTLSVYLSESAKRTAAGNLPAQVPSLN
jgi:hypothetical protein